jgi:hypothetical protein
MLTVWEKRERPVVTAMIIRQRSARGIGLVSAGEYE